MSKRLEIKSPKATPVRAVHATSGSVVAAGQLLFSLFDLEEQKVISSIDRAIEENASKAAELDGARVTAKYEGLKMIAQYRQSSVVSSTSAYESTVLGRDVGVRTTVDVINARQRVALSAYQTLQAAVEAEIFNRNTVDGKQVFEMIDKLLRAEKEYVERSITRLRIAAPRAGRFVSYVIAGTPVRVGHLLGEIE